MLEEIASIADNYISLGGSPLSIVFVSLRVSPSASRVGVSVLNVSIGRNSVSTYSSPWKVNFGKSFEPPLGHFNIDGMFPSITMVGRAVSRSVVTVPSDPQGRSLAGEHTWPSGLPDI